MSRVSNKIGFTLIELMLAMVFVSALLVAIAMTVMQISGIYNRGLTLKGVDGAGRAITSELQRVINSSAPFEVSDNFKLQDWGGRLCTGQYSYIWNYGKSMGNNSDHRNMYTDDDQTKISFVKVFDPGADYCGKINDSGKTIDKSKSVEMLNAGQYELAIHSFEVSSTITANDAATGQRLYNIKFLLGTNGSETLMPANNSCKPPSEAGSDISYCAVNQFNITARAGNKGE